MSIYQKLHAVMTDVAYIQKDKKNDHFKYRYASEAAIKEKVHDALVKHGLVFMPTAVKKVRHEGQITTISMEYCFFDIEDGERVCGSIEGDGQDSADKGAWKALTGCIKYALTSTFLIATGDDPEQDEAPVTKQSEPRTAPRPAAIPVEVVEPGLQGIFNRVFANGGKERESVFIDLRTTVGEDVFEDHLAKMGKSSWKDFGTAGEARKFITGLYDSMKEAMRLQEVPF